MYEDNYSPQSYVEIDKFLQSRYQGMNTYRSEVHLNGRYFNGSSRVTSQGKKLTTQMSKSESLNKGIGTTPRLQNAPSIDKLIKDPSHHFTQMMR